MVNYVRTDVINRGEPIVEYKADGSVAGISGNDWGPINLAESLTSYDHTPLVLGRWDEGGPFQHRQTRVLEHPHPWNEKIKGGIYDGRSLQGPGYASNAKQVRDAIGDMVTASPYASDAEMDVLGARAVKSCAPTNPVMSLYTTLGELRADGLPKFGLSTMQERTLRAKNAGGDYLNYQFGWLPLVSDIRGYANLIKNADRILRQYDRNSGKPIRRRLVLSEAVSYTGGTMATGVNTDPLPSSKFLGTGGRRSWVQQTRTRVYFSGSFMYYLPVSDRHRRNLETFVDRADKLLGFKLTPDSVWSIQPWSWFVDWFVNFGDITSNLSAFLFDGLVMQYGYLMKETRHTRYITLSGGSSVNGTPINAMTEIGHLVQQRRKANPFGFGLTKAGLSSKQLTILGALGLTLKA